MSPRKYLREMKICSIFFIADIMTNIDVFFSSKHLIKKINMMIGGLETCTVNHGTLMSIIIDLSLQLIFSFSFSNQFIMINSLFYFFTLNILCFTSSFFFFMTDLLLVCNINKAAKNLRITTVKGIMRCQTSAECLSWSSPFVTDPYCRLRLPYMYRTTCWHWTIYIPQQWNSMGYSFTFRPI